MTKRTRTIEWSDPVESLRKAAGMTGLDAMRAVASGELPPPPIAALMDFDIRSVDPGLVQFEVKPAEFHYNPIGVVHGGLAATLLDSVMGCAVHSTLDAGDLYTTLEIKVNYVRPMTRHSGLVIAEGKVIHTGGRVATAEGRAWVAATGKLVAHGTTTCFVQRAEAEQRAAA
jgi:uncharacterized protein (TIGR00369 family)